MSETLHFSKQLGVFFLNTFNVLGETHTLFVSVSVKTDWSIHVRWLPLAHVFDVKPAFAEKSQEKDTSA